MTYTVPPGRYSDVNSAFVQAYIDAAIAGVVDLAPETLNSLNELAAAINDDPAFYATVAAQVAELNTDVTDAVAALGVAENDTDVGTFSSPTLPDGTTLRAVLEAFAGAYDTTKSNLESADTALSGRIDTLEADPTTAAAVAAVQADVDQNELDSDAADLALSDRLDVLEADPTTQAYVDNAVSALVDLAPATLDTLNELAQSIGDDADFIGTMNAANTALSNRLDTLEADPTTQTVVDNLETALDGRLDVLEADPTTQTLLDAEATTRGNADTALSGRLDVLEADPTTATALTDGLALKASKAGDTFTGDIIIDEGTGSTIKLETSSALSAGIHIEGPTGSFGYFDTTNGFGNDSLQVYSANFWIRAINGGTGNIIIDGNISVPNLVGPYNNDGDAASNGVAVGSLYYDGNGHVKIRVS